MSPNVIILDNAAILDVVKGLYVRNQRVTIENDRITKIVPAVHPVVVQPSDGILIKNLAGKTLMPGLCDAHVHVTAWTVNLKLQHQMPPSYTTVRSARIINDMLMRGFTTVRDEGGADFGLARAIEEDYIVGPSLLYCGKALTQTGGHADLRESGDNNRELSDYGMGVLCDGVSAVRQACRDEIRKGAHHIKLMLSGGVISPTDRISNLQFSEDEIKAAVEEAHNAGLYCSGHTYTSAAVNRAIRYGVRSVEHCNLIDQSSVDLCLENDAFMVPTLITYAALAELGADNDVPQSTLAKLKQVKDAGLTALKLADAAGVNIVFGTDLLGHMHARQLEELTIRASIQKPIDVIRSATITAAELFNQKGEIGIVAEGAYADLLVVDGDPISDIGILTDPDIYLKAIIKRGKIIKDLLS